MSELFKHLYFADSSSRCYMTVLLNILSQNTIIIDNNILTILNSYVCLRRRWSHQRFDSASCSNTNIVHNHHEEQERLYSLLYMSTRISNLNDRISRSLAWWHGQWWSSSVSRNKYTLVISLYTHSPVRNYRQRDYGRLSYTLFNNVVVYPRYNTLLSARIILYKIVYTLSRVDQTSIFMNLSPKVIKILLKFNTSTDRIF